MTVQVNEEGAVRPIRAAYAYEQYVMGVLCARLSLVRRANEQRVPFVGQSVQFGQYGQWLQRGQWFQRSGFLDWPVSVGPTSSGCLFSSICSIWAIWSVVVVPFLKYTARGNSTYS